MTCFRHVNVDALSHMSPPRQQLSYLVTNIDCLPVTISTWEERKYICLLHRYNWIDGKQTFALSAVELGTLIDPPIEGIKDLFHDPNKGSRCEDEQHN